MIVKRQIRLGKSSNEGMRYGGRSGGQLENWGFWLSVWSIRIGLIIMFMIVFLK